MSLFSHKKSDATTAEEPAQEMTHVKEPVADAPIAEAPQETATSDVPADSVPEATATNCNTTAHLMSYPLVKETVELVEKIPGVSTIESASKPVAEFMHEQSLLKPAVDTIDKMGSSALEMTENVVPCMKTVGYEDIANTIEAPFIAASDGVKKCTQWTNETVEENVCSPSKQLIKDFRAYYNEHLYDTKGKPLLRSSMDPLVRPVNSYMESMAKNYLPETEPMTHEFSSEIEKNMFLSYDITKRSIPVVMNKKLEIVMSPYNYTMHAVDIFKDNWAKQSPGSIMSPLNATYNSSIDLASEAWTSTMNVFNGVIWSKTVPESVTAEVTEPETTTVST